MGCCDPLPERLLVSLGALHQVISNLNQALTRNRSAFFTFKSSINIPYYYSYISALALLGFAGGDAGCSISVVNGADKLIASEKKRSSHSERDLEQLLV